MQTSSISLKRAVFPSSLIWKFTSQEEIAALGPGEYFGEMALFSNDKRTASVAAKTDIGLLRVDKNAFLQLVRTDGVIARKVGDTIAKRNEELALREKLVDITGIRRRDLHISIKGDQSLRETALSRERYESVVDKILPMLQPRLEDLLLNRCIYQVVIGFNNGEVITSSVFDPFGEEIQQAAKLVDEAYIDRQFPVVDYKEKTLKLQRLRRDCP